MVLPVLYSFPLGYFLEEKQAPLLLQPFCLGVISLSQLACSPTSFILFYM